MSKINDGGSAFPCDSRIGTSPGMTLRDHFAAKAMQGMLANDWAMGEIKRQAVNSHGGKMIPLIAAEAYGLADAMLAERGKEREE